MEGSLLLLPLLLLSLRFLCASFGCWRVSLELLLFLVSVDLSRPFLLSYPCRGGCESDRVWDLSRWVVWCVDALPSRYALSLMLRMSSSV